MAAFRVMAGGFRVVAGSDRNLARHASDAAAVLEVIAGRDSMTPHCRCSHAEILGRN